MLCVTQQLLTDLFSAPATIVSDSVTLNCSQSFIHSNISILYQIFCTYTSTEALL